MCGIAGFLNFSHHSKSGSQESEARILRAMTETLTHRGPDEDGYLAADPVYLGMRRLKIIDLSTGKQPMFNEDGSVAVVFNGEIYNYVELRKELIKKGHTFRTQSDTEVLVHLYEEEGVRFPQRLRGMFAFALWDKKHEELILGRDHFGIKPLYWGIFDNRLLFGSEVKALLSHPSFVREIDFDAIDDFLTLLFIPTPKTAYKNLYKLEPGTTLSINRSGQVKKDTYWDPVQQMAIAQQNPLTNLIDVEEELDSKIDECVKLVLRSDVPLGVFLSSGLDSTTITAYAQKHQANLKTFTIYYKEKSYSERDGARAVANLFHTDHTEIPMDVPADIPPFVWKVLSLFDQPFGDLSSLPTYLLCQAARQHITVALSGDGGDELFGGYPTTIANQIFSVYRHLPSFARSNLMPFLANLLPTNMDRVSADYKIKRFVEGSVGLDDPLRAQFVWRGAFMWHERAEVYQKTFFDSVRSRVPYEAAFQRIGPLRSGASLFDKSSMTDLRVYLLDQYLIKADMTSMAHSLELRPALLDPELAELSFRIPSHFKIRHFQTKWILRHMMNKKLPQEIIDMPKKGFTPPLAHWLQEKSFQKFIRDVTSASSFKNLGIFAEGAIERILSEHAAGKKDHTRRLWAILSLANFAEKAA